MQAETQQFVDEVVAARSDLATGLLITVEARAGRAGEVLIEAAEGAELLVVGHRGRGSVASRLLGSVGLHCVLHASCPITVVPGPGADRATARSRGTGFRSALTSPGGRGHDADRCQAVEGVRRRVAERANDRVDPGSSMTVTCRIRLRGGVRSDPGECQRWSCLLEARIPGPTLRPCPPPISRPRRAGPAPSCGSTRCSPLSPSGFRDSPCPMGRWTAISPTRRCTTS